MAIAQRTTVRTEPGYFHIIDHDQKILDGCVFYVVPSEDMISGGGGQIPFQFLPEITDGKSATWDINKDVKSYERMKIWTGADNRKITLKSTYIITGQPPFDVYGISRIIRIAKSYFYRDMRTSKFYMPKIELAIFNLIPIVNGKYSTWIATNVSLVYSGPTITGIPGSGQTLHSDSRITRLAPDNNTDNYHMYMKTEITWSLELVTGIAIKETGVPIHADTSLPPIPLFGWY